VCKIEASGTADPALSGGRVATLSPKRSAQFTNACIVPGVAIHSGQPTMAKTTFGHENVIITLFTKLNIGITQPDVVFLLIKLPGVAVCTKLIFVKYERFAWASIDNGMRIKENPAA
jgi:hypothetical protein